MFLSALCLPPLIVCGTEQPLTPPQRFAEQVVAAVTALESLAFVADIEETTDHWQSVGDRSRSLQARVLMADGGRFRVAVSENGQDIAVFVSNGREVTEWDAKERRWTRYPLPPAQEGRRRFRNLLFDDLLVDRYAESWVDEHNAWAARLLRELSRCPKAHLGAERVDGREYRKLTLTEKQIVKRVPPMWVTATATLLFDAETHVPRSEVHHVEAKFLGAVAQSTRRAFTCKQVRINPPVSPEDFAFSMPGGSRFIPPEQLDSAHVRLDGRPAPDFTLPSTDGAPASLRDYKGKVVLLVFWGTWCFPCKQMLRELRPIQKEFGDRGFSVVAISIDSSEDALKGFLKRHPLGFRVLHDANGKVARTYGGTGIPREVLINQDGIVVKTWMQGASRELISAIRREVEKMFR